MQTAPGRDGWRRNGPGQWAIEGDPIAGEQPRYCLEAEQPEHGHYRQGAERIVSGPLPVAAQIGAERSGGRKETAKTGMGRAQHAPGQAEGNQADVGQSEAPMPFDPGRTEI